MKKLTINQIILLLDIHRGTDTQISIGTRFNDILHLIKLDLITYKINKEIVAGKELILTTKGQDLVTHIKQTINNSLENQ